jgi:prepilin-type N-terminal cleavage/methylation domain-containing protein
MRNDVSKGRSRQAGFSLVEMLIVVAIVAIMAAVALPNIGQYIRNYKVRGAAQDVAGVMQAARSKAIMSNTNAGVSFYVVDLDSYRFVQEDLPAGEQYGPLQDLPNGVQFVPATAANSGPSLRFNRLGSYCNPADSASGCATAAPLPCTPAESSRCNLSPGTSFVQPDPAMTGGLVVTVIESNTGLRRTVRLAPGGRVLPQP